MKTASIFQNASHRSVRRQINKISFRKRKKALLSRVAGVYCPQVDYAWESLLAAKSNVDLLAAIGTNFAVLTGLGAIDQALIETFPSRLRTAAKIYTAGQHTIAVGRACVMGSASIKAVGSLAHVNATGNTVVILEGASASISQDVRVFAQAGSKVRRFTTPNSL